MKKCVAVLLPIYKNDSLEYFKLSLNSVFSQTFHNYKIFVGVDGEVPYATKSYLQEMDKRGDVEVCWFPKNRGLACVLNDLIAIAHVQGFDYLARMDADDVMLSSRLQKQMSYMESHKDIDVVGGAIEEMDKQSISRGKTIIYPLTHQECVNFFEKRNPLAHPAVLFRYSFFEKLKGAYRADHPKNQDTMLWLDGLMAGCKMANVPDVVLQFRVTNDLFRKRRNGWNLAMRQLADRLEVNRGLKYGVMSYLYAYATFLMQISPAWVKKLCYRYLR